ncbi:unnamed protein product [Ceratitis capitata]|uniref:(Mediterranean fruit fly) hypothetical protein n=1 Tax=Ceratitis capitata TaxID=7213 RepID=A0A811U4I7_CERCA|nr:unnamed protein product [Ceratitis capitata]
MKEDEWPMNGRILKLHACATAAIDLCTVPFWSGTFTHRLAIATHSLTHSATLHAVELQQLVAQVKLPQAGEQSGRQTTQAVFYC